MRSSPPRIVLLLLMLVSSAIAGPEAHRSGCHRWHSCPSDLMVPRTAAISAIAPSVPIMSVALEATPERLFTSPRSLNRHPQQKLRPPQ
jgi:hypothetical protein